MCFAVWLLTLRVVILVVLIWFDVCYVWWFDACVVWSISAVFCGVSAQVVGLLGLVCNLVVLCIMDEFGLWVAVVYLVRVGVGYLGLGCAWFPRGSYGFCLWLCEFDGCL